MSKKEALARYKHIIGKLRKIPCNYVDLMDYLDRQSELQGYNFRISKRTLKRDLDDILSVFNIDIQFDFRQGVYHIVSDNDDDAAMRMLESYDMLQALNLSDGLSQYILFERRPTRGTEHFNGLLHAIQNRHTVHFTYEKFWDGTFSQRKLQPYALKEFKGRWYAVGTETGQDQIKTFALDRISELEILKQKFKPVKAFDTEHYFRHAFGIIAEPGTPPEIILSFDAEQGKYIKSYPLHHSQQVLIDNKDEFRIALYLHPTYDFLMELLAHHNSVEVMAPASLQCLIKEKATDVVKLYN